MRPLRDLDKELLDGDLEGLDLRLELRALVDEDRRGDDRARDARRAAERLLGAHKHVRHVLVLAQQRQVQQDLKRLRVGREHQKLALATVQRLGRCGRKGFSVSGLWTANF
jgi:hypothetical protein